MSSDIEAGQLYNEMGYGGRRAQIKELERQLRGVPRWLAAQRRRAEHKVDRLTAKIVKLKKAEANFNKRNKGKRSAYDGR